MAWDNAYLRGKKNWKSLTFKWIQYRADLSQGMANSQMEPWNNLWADLSQGMANSQIEPWNNL